MSYAVPTKLARYPFFDEAKDVVGGRVGGFEDLVSDAVLERAEERVVNSIEGRTVGEITSSTEDELYSYPVARAVVSAIDKHALTRRYAWAEANTAYRRFQDDLKQSGKSFGSVGDARTDFNEVRDELDFDLESGPESYELAVDRYLELASGMSDEEWKLVNRAVSDGWVEVSRSDVLELAREAVRQRISDDLPIETNSAVEEAVAPAVETVKEVLAETQLTTDIERVEEGVFPPCMKALLSDIREGEHLDHHSRFAITAFLSNIGMDTDDIVETYEVNPGFEEDMTRYQTDHIQGETSPTEYSCPSCATMVTYGDCRNRDELCETINHPLGYYRKKLEDLDEEEESGGDEAKEEDVEGEGMDGEVEEGAEGKGG
ncbi:MAG: DNA primase regulatory subunit PriL [Halobacteria archaeon]